MRTKFSWDFYISSPTHYSSELKYAKAFYGDNGEETVDVFDETAMAGLGNVTATPFSVNPPHGEVSIPKGIDMVWVSIADKKIYRANIKFSQQIQNKLLKAFREGFYKPLEEKVNMDFNEFECNNSSRRTSMAILGDRKFKKGADLRYIKGGRNTHDT